MKVSAGIMVLGVFIIVLSLLVPTFAIINVSSSNTTQVTSQFSPIQNSTHNLIEFNQPVHSSSGGYIVYQNYNNIKLAPSTSSIMEFQVPNGGYTSAVGNAASIGTVTLIVKGFNNGIIYQSTVTFNKAKIASSWDYTDVCFNFVNNEGGAIYSNVNISLSVTSLNLWQYLPSGSVTTIAGSANIFYVSQTSISNNVFGYPWHYPIGETNISKLITSDVSGFSLDWFSTMSISLYYNGITETGTSGTFTNSLPSEILITNIYPIGITQGNYNNYSVTFSLSNVVLNSASTTNVKNIGSFYIEIGNNWTKITRTSIINLTVSNYPTNLIFAYVEDNGTTSNMNGAYITVGQGNNIANYSIELQSNLSSVGNFVAYTVKIPIQASGTYDINGFLTSTNSSPLMLMSIVLPPDGTITSQPTVPINSGLTENQIITMSVGAVVIIIGIVMYLRKW